MSSIEMDVYAPMDPPASTGMDIWRRMAKLWCPSGVVRGVGNELWPLAWDQTSESWLVGSGACWVNGFYGELVAGKLLSVPGNVGLVVARMDPFAQNIRLIWKQGEGHGPTEEMFGIWEVPLQYLRGTYWEDRRPLIPPEPERGLIEIPPWVPRGAQALWSHPTIDVGVGGNIIAGYLDWLPGWAPGRRYRVSAYALATRLVAGDSPQCRIELTATRQVDGAVLARATVLDHVMHPNVPIGGWASFTLVNALNCQLRLDFASATGLGQYVLRLNEGDSRIEIEDLGAPE